jgi:hypothetical protein
LGDRAIKIVREKWRMQLEDRGIKIVRTLGTTWDNSRGQRTVRVLEQRARRPNGQGEATTTIRVMDFLRA